MEMRSVATPALRLARRRADEVEDVQRPAKAMPELPADRSELLERPPGGGDRPAHRVFEAMGAVSVKCSRTFDGSWRRSSATDDVAGAIDMTHLAP